jgi:ABC-type nitrate/sulfonate/bicarbonate transport system permease component
MSLSAASHSPVKPRAAMSHAARVRWLRRGVILGLIVFWQIGALLYNNPGMIAPPSTVVGALFGEVLSDASIRAAIGLTLFEIVSAYGLAILGGLAIGLAIGWTGTGRRGVTPIVLLLYAIPQVVLLPLFTLIFGIGPAAKIAFGVSHGIFPVIVNVVAGMRNVNALLLLSARAQGASSADIIRHVIFPQMVPSFFAGLRLSMTMTMLGVILAELYISTAGVGYFTKLFADNFNSSSLFALIGTLAVIAVVLNELVRIAERRFMRWKA